MKPKYDEQASTSDFAGPRDEARGRGNDEIIARDDDRPAAPVNAAPQAPSADHRARDRAQHQTETAERWPQQGEQGRQMLLFPGDEAEAFRTRWSDIQVAFVDAPRQAVERADGLVANVMKRLAEVFAAERDALEQQWDRGDQVTTEDLRVALQRYRAFFDRLLSM